MKTSVKMVFNNIPQVRRATDPAKIAMAGGQTLQAYARINVNNTFSENATGGLQESIQVVLVNSSETSAMVHIGPTKIYGRIQELGGWIYPVFKRMLSWIDKATGQRIFSFASYIPPRPYLRPAFDEHKADIKRAMEVQIIKQMKGIK